MVTYFTSSGKRSEKRTVIVDWSCGYLFYKFWEKKWKKKKKLKDFSTHLPELTNTLILSQTHTWTLYIHPRRWELRTQKLKSHLVRTQSWNVLPLRPGVSQYVAIHTTLTARNFFLAYFYPSGPFTCIFFQNLSSIFFLRFFFSF